MERYHSGDGNRTSGYDAKSSGQPEGNGGAKAACAPHSKWFGQNADRTRACEPKRRAHTGNMIAAVLKGHRGLSLRELIAALDREFGWKSTESHVTALLYTNQKKFAHTKPDRAANRAVTWSLK